MYIEKEFYRKIIEVFPIPCVDLLVVNSSNRILLVKRVNAPEKGSWWFPGGRIHKGESRENAAIRKLKEECGVSKYSMIKEVGTYDVFLDTDKDKNQLSHGITTVFKINIVDQEICLDDQSEAFKWESFDLMRNDQYHSFIYKVSKTSRIK